jgi:hypothetical protein
MECTNCGYSTERSCPICGSATCEECSIICETIDICPDCYDRVSQLAQEAIAEAMDDQDLPLTMNGSLEVDIWTEL